MKRSESSALRMLKADFCLLMIILPTFLGCPYSSANPLSQKLKDFSGYDMDNNRIDEIEYLELLPFESEESEIPLDGNLVLVLVEPRLLDEIPNCAFSSSDLLERLQEYKGHLEAEGYYTRFIETKVYDGTRHQDGRTVLALREFFIS